jgi:hypothetical protein
MPQKKNNPSAGGAGVGSNALAVSARHIASINKFAKQAASEADHVAVARDFNRGLISGRFSRRPTQGSLAYFEGRRQGYEELECYRTLRRAGEGDAQ